MMGGVTYSHTRPCFSSRVAGAIVALLGLGSALPASAQPRRNDETQVAGPPVAAPPALKNTSDPDAMNAKLGNARLPEAR